MSSVGQRVDLVGDELSLVALVVADVADDLLPVALRGPQVLRATIGVLRDHRVGRGQDVLRGAVILLEQNRRGVRVIALEVLDVADRGEI